MSSNWTEGEKHIWINDDGQLRIVSLDNDAMVRVMPNFSFMEEPVIEIDVNKGAKHDNSAFLNCQESLALAEYIIEFWRNFDDRE